jgi:hypothetical protein
MPSRDGRSYLIISITAEVLFLLFIAADSRKVELEENADALGAQLIEAMGFDLAAIHAATCEPALLLADLNRRTAVWLTEAAETAAGAVEKRLRRMGERNFEIKDNKLRYVHNYAAAQEFHVASSENVPEESNAPLRIKLTALCAEFTASNASTIVFGARIRGVTCVAPSILWAHVHDPRFRKLSLGL